MDRDLKSLRSTKRMPVPASPRVGDYGKMYVEHAHDVTLFPAITRPKQTVQSGVLMEAGQSSCYFHPELSATALCDESGRMICDLCKTEWEGRTVSMEALQTLVAGKGKKRSRGKTKWDDICLALALLPIILGPLSVVTALAVLVIVGVQWRKGPTSVVRRSRWRYVLAALLALLQVFGWGFWFFILFTGGNI